MSQTLIRSMGLGVTRRALISRSLSSPAAHHNEPDRATPQQLNEIESKVVHHLPRFFYSPHPVGCYTHDVKFIDNIRGIRTRGIGHYAIQLNLIKMYHYLKYTSTKVEVLNLVKNPQESFIRIRWRIVARPGIIYFMLFFWKFHKQSYWTDGISTLHVNAEGKIYCHVCDNIDLDIDSFGKAKEKQGLKNPIVGRGIHV